MSYQPPNQPGMFQKPPERPMRPKRKWPFGWSGRAWLIIIAVFLAIGVIGNILQAMGINVTGAATTTTQSAPATSTPTQVQQVLVATTAPTAIPTAKPTAKPT